MGLIREPENKKANGIKFKKYFIIKKIKIMKKIKKIES